MLGVRMFMALTTEERGRRVGRAGGRDMRGGRGEMLAKRPPRPGGVLAVLPSGLVQLGVAVLGGSHVGLASRAVLLVYWSGVSAAALMHLESTGPAFYW